MAASKPCITHRLLGEYRYGNLLISEDFPRHAIDKVPGFTLDGDVLLSSYPKTGSTWMSEILWLVVHGGDIESARKSELLHRIPVLELDSSDVCSMDILKTQDHPRVIRSHLSARFFERQLEEEDVKVVVTIRNPKDTLVSFYHLYRMSVSMGNFNGTWDEFFEMVRQKHILHGDYFDWYMDWSRYQNHKNVKFVHYEAMKRDLRTTLTDLCKFLGCRIEENRIDNVIDHLSFKSMKENTMTNYSNFPGLKADISPFMRRGIVGDWKNYFTAEQEKYIDDRYRDTILKTGLTVQFE